MYIVYVTEECKRESQAHGLLESVMKFKEDIEKKQNISRFDKFPEPYFVKKQIGDKRGRLLAIKIDRQILDKIYEVIIFLVFLFRGEKEYDIFQQDVKKNGKKYLERVPNDKIISEYLNKNIKAPNYYIKPEINDSEKEYLHSPNIFQDAHELNNEPLIYETESWVNFALTDTFDNNREKIWGTIRNIIDNLKNFQSDGICDIRDSVNLKIRYHVNLQENKLLLHEIIDTNSDINNTNVEYEDNIRLYRRVYPQYLLYDSSLWYKIQRDKQSNYVLSAEETEIIKNISFPLFIRGRAGSGKTTILQYLFAKYFSRYLTYKSSVSNPAYFTYNNELLTAAKECVRNLLKAHSSMIEKSLNKEDELKMEKSFLVFKNYLLSLIPSEEKNKYSEKNYINYTRFVNWWKVKFERNRNAIREYSPDISWHIIRSYIQGFNIDGYLETNDYANIPKEQKSLTLDTYKKVYNIVWNAYNEYKEVEKLWDDQDLARFILGNNLLKPIFSGIFCDEAQDFTRIELEILFRCSIFSDRTIAPDPSLIKKLPFAFAGDELQTLNPTGFSWDSVSAWFTEGFVFPIISDTKKVSLKPKELKNNYRSHTEIVRFSNSIQLFRANRFEMKRLTPQKSWSTDEYNSVYFFSYDNANFWRGIENLLNVVFIIPSNEGKEEVISWIKEKDNGLIDKITLDENDTPSKTILTSNQAKGREYDYVVVYGFGSEHKTNMLLSDAVSTNDDNSLQSKYYINKLYVALSRAKKKLFIVDKNKIFWQEITKNAKMNDYIKEIDPTGTNWTMEDVLQIRDGNEKSFNTAIQTTQKDIEEDARNWEKEGLSESDSIKMRYAARDYRRAHINPQSESNANKCEGYANLFENKYAFAGRKFLSSGDLTAATLSFWLDKDYKSVSKIIQEYQLNKLNILKILSYAINAKDNSEFIVDAIEKYSQNEIDDIFAEKYFQQYRLYEILNIVIGQLVKKIMQLKETKRAVLLQITKISNSENLKIENNDLAEIYFMLEDYEKAKQLWGNVENNINNKKYLTAKAHTTSFPNNIKDFDSLKDYDSIISHYERNIDNINFTDDKLWTIITNAFICKGRFTEAMQSLVHVNSYIGFKKLESNDEKLSKILNILQNISKIQYRDNMADNKFISDLQKLINDREKLKISNEYIALAISRTTNLINKKSIEQESISSFLNNEFIKKFEKIPDDIISDIGIAIEKAGKIIFALDYYEKVISFCKNNNLDHIKYIIKWISVKRQHAEISNTEEQKQQRIEEITKRMLDYGITEDNISTIEDKALTWQSLYSYIINNEKTKFTNTILEANISSQDINRNILFQNENFKISRYTFDYYCSKNKLLIKDDDGNDLKIKDNIYVNDGFNILETKEEKKYNVNNGDFLLTISNEQTVVFFPKTKITITFE